MKVGDVVIRAYAHKGILPGIIVDQYEEIIGGCEHYGDIASTMFIVQWADGLQTGEMYEELDLYEISLIWSQ